MIPRGVLTAALIAALTIRLGAEGPARPPGSNDGMERHHYSITARVRPLVMFWITRRDIGDAVTSRSVSPGEVRYSLLIGSDPNRTPLRINRWGYLEEQIRGADARLVGVMTESDEQSLEQAQANIRRQSGGSHTFTAINTHIDGEQAHSRVTSFSAPENYTFRQWPVVLGLVTDRQPSSGTSRVVALPPGARPGFLAALSDVIHDPSLARILYAHYGRVYELRRTRVRTVSNLRIGEKTYGRAIAADFVIVNTHNGEETHFSLTYGTEGVFADVPLQAVFQPRWWMQIELTLDDQAGAPALLDGASR
jgi:hypothetical protein